MSPGGLGIRNELADRVRVVGFELRNVDVRERHPELETATAELIQELRQRYESPPSAADWTEPARRLYRAMGMDPSRRRPSSEALLRRILQGKGLYRVNTAVDAANLASLRIALPVGLYDRDKIVAPASQVTLRLGRFGEAYDGIRKDEIHVGDRPTLADELGAFGNPSSDSARTQVSSETRSLFFVVYGPEDIDHQALLAAAETARDTMTAFVGGRSSDLVVA